MAHGWAFPSSLCANLRSDELFARFFLGYLTASGHDCLSPALVVAEER